MLHLGWSKMIVFKTLSDIERNRIEDLPKQKIILSIKDQNIFRDLEYIFLNTTGYRKIYIRLFEDMDKFDFIGESSAPDAENFDYIASDFSHIMLYSHTMNVFKKMVFIIKSHHELNQQKDIFLLLALLHDFGKSKNLCDYYQIDPKEKHWIRSSKYFIKLIEEDIQSIDDTSYRIIVDTLKIHHSKTTETQRKNIFLQTLILADSQARESEKFKEV